MVGLGFLTPARPRRLRADHRRAVLPEAGRDPLRPHDRAAGQPRPHRRPQRPDPRRQRSGAVDLGDPEGPRRRRRRPRQARRAARHDERRARDAGSPTTRTSSGCAGRSTTTSPRSVRALDVKGIHEVREYKRKYPEGEAGGARRRLHQRRGPRPGGHRARVPEGAGRPRRHAPRHQGPARPRRRGRRRQRRAGRRPGHRPGDRFEGAVLRLPAHPRRGRREQGQGRQRRRARRADRRGARARQLPELFARRPQEPDRRAAAQPRAHRHLRAGLDDEAVHRRLGARDRPRHADDRHPDRARAR